MKRILVGVDGSEASQRALEFAGELARTSGANLFVLYVRGLVAYPSELHGSLLAQQAEAEKAEGARILSMSRASMPGTPMETLSCSGPIAATLAKKGDEFDVDLIVAGKQGKSAAVRLILGSVTDRLAHIAKRPVLVVP